MNKNIVGCFDVETTGVSINEDKIVQIYLAIFEEENSQLTKIKEFNFFIDPILADSYKESSGMLINKIDWEYLKTCPPFTAIASELLKELNSIDYFIAYNFHFDKNITATEFLRCGYTLKDLIFLSKPCLDTFKLWLMCEKRSLGDAIKRFLKQEPDQTKLHDASYDIQKTIEIIEPMIKSFELETLSYLEIANTIEPVEKIVDPMGMLVKVSEPNTPIFYKFKKGKHKDKSFDEVLLNDPSYIDWLIKDSSTTLILKNVLKILAKK